jgi:hypothetical protein
MMCHGYDRKISAYLDGQLTEPEHREVLLHLSHCDQCASATRHSANIRAKLRSLPKAASPDGLQTALRVIASKEKVRRTARASLGAFLHHCHENVRLRVNNLMRPLAIPAVGGLASAIVLFSMLVPTFNKPVAEGRMDVPTPFYTAAAVKSSMSPSGFLKDELFIELTIDANGRMVEYSIPEGQPIVEDAELIRAVEKQLLFTEFTPATNFGRPMYGGKIRVYMRISSIEVKG